MELGCRLGDGDGFVKKTRGAGRAGLVAGVGGRRGVAAADVAAALNAALKRANRSLGAVTVVATPAAKGLEPGIVEAAAAFGLPLVAVADAGLAAVSGQTMTQSPRVVALFGVPSVSEAAALAAAGGGARLLGPRIAVGGATCALAEVVASPHGAGDASAAGDEGGDA